MVLKSFRDASHSLVIKILFTAIILSFCLWGVGDIIRNYSASRAVAKIDKTRITADQFLREFSQEKQRIRNLGAKPLTDAEMERLDIKGMVLDKLINTAVVERSYERFGIIVPRQSLVSLVHAMPEFQRNGGFDSKIYEMALRHSGMSESGFLMKLRDSVARTQLFHPVIAGYKVPTMIKDVIAKNFEAMQTVVVATIDLNNQKFKSKFSDDELQQYYENNKDKYQIPETRDVSILMIDYGRLLDDMPVDEQEVERMYEANKDLYIQIESRTFERFEFDEEKSANKGWELINRGVATKEIVKRLSPTVTVIESAHKNDFPESIGKVLFGLKEGKTSDVLKIGNKFYIYKLNKINRAKQKTKKEIMEEIRAEFQNEKLNSPEFYARIKKIRNQIDDGFGAGKTIEEIAKETGMKIENIKKISRENVRQAAKLIPDDDTRTEIVNAIFETDEGQSSSTIDSKETDMKSYVVVVNKIMKATFPDYKSIKPIVLHDYTIKKAEKTLREDLSDIASQGENAVSALRSKYAAAEFQFKKRALLTNTNEATADVKKILKLIPSRDVLMNIIMGLRAGEITFHKLSGERYIAIGIKKIEMPQTTEPKFYDIISRYVDRFAESEIITIAVEAFKKVSNIKIYEKLVQEITKNSDEQGID